MRVYIVLHGENHEGGAILGVFENELEAIAEAKKTKTCFLGGWVKEKGKLTWENGCDFVTVQEWDVE